MPVFNSLKMKYGIYPGILVSENQIEATEFKRLGGMQQVHQMLPIIKCVDGKESFSLEYKLLTVENQVTDTVHRDTRNVMSKVSLTAEMDRKHSLVEGPATDVKSFLVKDVPVLEKEAESNPPLLTLSSAHECDDHRSVHHGLGHGNPADSKRASVSKPSISHCLSFSSSKITSKEGFKMPHTSNYEFLPESDGCEILQNCNIIETEGHKLPRTCMDQKIIPVPEQQVLKYSSTPSFTDIQESSLSSIEPYPIPEVPSLLLLEPLLLMQQDMADGSRTPILKKHRRRKEQLNHSEQQKVARIMIGYTLAFFLLAIVTFYVVYFV
jgi:hypothetical protein